MSNGSTSLETRQRLLEAASEVFAESGYRSATLREICRRAEANSAAVNYHYGDKQRLYFAVIEHAMELAQDQLPSKDLDPAEPAEAQLRSFIRAALRGLLGSGSPTRLLKLMAQEMVEPTPGMDLMVEKVVRPVNTALSRIVEELLGPGADGRLVGDCTSSIMAQCVSYHHSQPIVVRLGRYVGFDDATIEHLADHIAEFSLGGLQAINRRRAEKLPEEAISGR
ncbi:MAG: CerR family C-terminal domain-containing protein [Pirellulales bacterium]|nr:CerR family C-terminal domain-containing protein [Pirellulales bacterium]